MNVDIYYIHDENRKKSPLEYVKALWYFPKNYYYGLTPKRVAEIVTISKEYDIVWIDRSIFGILAKSLKNSGYKGKIVVFFHNIEPNYFNVKLPKHLPLRNIIINCVKANDKYSCDFADTTVALTSRDSKDIESLYNRRIDFIAPIVMRDEYIDDTDKTLPISNPPLCTILAAYFKPNNEGIHWFIENVYNHIPIRLRIVGKGMEKLRDESWMPDSVDIRSNVPDISPYMKEADIMILPIFEGSGMKVKTCESLMYGKNILATPEAWVGYDLDYNQAGAYCETAEDFINAIKKTIGNIQSTRFNAYSRSAFLKSYSTESLREKFKDIISE